MTWRWRNVVTLASVAAGILGLVLSAGGFGSNSAVGDDFRIQTHMFVGDQTQPSGEALTLFRDGIVYDYVTDPEKIAVFDAPRKRFILLDPRRKIKTEVETARLLAYGGHFRKWAAQQQSALLRFTAQPSFQQQYDRKSGEMTFSSPHLTYRLATETAASAELAKQYWTFSDWYARLNSATSAAALPPFARLAVNESLAEHQLLPRRVELTIRPAKTDGDQPVVLRTEHRMRSGLSTSDVDRIDRTATYLHTFRTVSFKQFIAAADEDRAAVEKKPDSP